ncbi:hypothetical protein SE17_01165 [Kouleothrix aurantiaca]|uniref:Uncharacterized protein n=1 Tax=Kouleothrix aurantiaca TaxID=186479 RepID=A0A0P9HIU4_9CHLR|nr:hypothetical protein SE17_01165 [Kouleothrix aurantiaca]
MPNPRDTVEFDGINAHYVTMKCDGSTIVYDNSKPNGSAQIGLAAAVSADKTVALTQDGDPVFGKITKVEIGNFCVVQRRGGMKLPGGNGATLTAGRRVVGALGASSARGYIRAVAAATGSYVQGTMQDALNGRGEIVDASDPTAVALFL